MPVVIPIAIAATAAATIGSAVIASQGAKEAAQTQADAQQAAIEEQRRAQEAQIASEEKAVAEQKAVAEKAAAEKEIALKDFKLPGVFDIPEGQKLKTTLEERMAGMGTGYTPSLVNINKEAAPFAAQRRASVKDIEIPTISAEASGRGLGRSTIPISRIASSTQAAERDIESRIAELTLVNTDLERQAQAQKSVDIQNALTQYGGLTEQQSRAKQLEAEAIRTGKFDIADTELGAANTRFSAAGVAANARLDSASDVTKLIQAEGATSAAYQLQQAAIQSSAIMEVAKSASQAYSMSNNDIINAIRTQKAENGARVNIAGAGGQGNQEVLTAPRDYYMNQGRLLPVGG